MPHLAARRELKAGNIQIERTPLLVPSFSSRVPDVEKVFRACEEFIDGPTLVSAYDVAQSVILPPYDFGSIVFLDSGGYEVSTELDLSDVSTPAPRPGNWTPEDHAKVLAAWSPRVPSVVISYDHPTSRHPLKTQIETAKSLSVAPGIARELLLKPESREQQFLQIGTVLPKVRELANFDVIGVTEKEIGNSVLDRMKNISRLRMALTKVGLDTPIHVFGSLDSITTLFYFVAGADIFDGLTWLRYAFKDGNTLYRQNFGILELGVSTKAPKVEALCWAKNYQYMKEMELEMRRFLTEHKFDVFAYHGPKLEAAYKNIVEELEA